MQEVWELFLVKVRPVLLREQSKQCGEITLLFRCSERSEFLMCYFAFSALFYVWGKGYRIVNIFSKSNSCLTC